MNFLGKTALTFVAAGLGAIAEPVTVYFIEKSEEKKAEQIPEESIEAVEVGPEEIE